ncbi:uncharacterized protein DEA37_0012474 [Paragonimus westermani]|uniref:Uncharacterized protein n=1 Tax=Paragonimus westermani TaxID=34504 RepID=A0A5J4NEH4_9TREM|nr:uncharacterized protein DEA37_0012474 [Paragonimus westermani]
MRGRAPPCHFCLIRVGYIMLAVPAHFFAQSLASVIYADLKPQETVARSVSTATATAKVGILCNQFTPQESSPLASACCHFPTSHSVDIDAEVKSNDDNLSNSITSLEAATTLARTLSSQTMMLHYAVLGHSPPLYGQGNMAGSSLHTLVLLPDLRLTGTTATAAGIIAGLPVRTADQCSLSLDKSGKTSPKRTSASVTEVDDQEPRSSQSVHVPSDRSNTFPLKENTMEQTQFSTNTNVSIDPTSTSASCNQILKLEPPKSNGATTHTRSFRAKRRPSLTLLKLPSSSQTQPSPASGVIPKGTFLPTPVLEAELKKLECQPSPFMEALKKLTPSIPDPIRPDIATEADRFNSSEVLVCSQANSANKSAHLMSVPLPKTPTTPTNSFPTYGSSLCRSPDIFVVPFLGIVNGSEQENPMKTLTSASESDPRPSQSILSSCVPSITSSTSTSLGNSSLTDSLKTCAIEDEPSDSRKFNGKHRLSLTLPPRSLENMTDDSPLLGIIPQGTFLSTPDVVTELERHYTWLQYVIEKLEFPSASLTGTNGNAIKREMVNPPSSDLPVCQPKPVFAQSVATNLCASNSNTPELRTNAFMSTSSSGCTSPVSSSSPNHALSETRQVDLRDADVITGKHAKRCRRA